MPLVAVGVVVPLYAAAFTIVWVRRKVDVPFGLLLFQMIGTAAFIVATSRNPALRGARLIKPRYLPIVVSALVAWLLVMLILPPSLASPLEPAAGFALLDFPLVILCCVVVASRSRGALQQQS